MLKLAGRQHLVDRQMRVCCNEVIHLAATAGLLLEVHLQRVQEMLHLPLTDPSLFPVGELIVGVFGQAQPPLAILNGEVLERVRVLLQEGLQLALTFANHHVVQVRVWPAVAAEDVLDLLERHTAFEWIDLIILEEADRTLLQLISRTQLGHLKHCILDPRRFALGPKSVGIDCVHNLFSLFASPERLHGGLHGPSLWFINVPIGPQILIHPATLG
mmetsp:Transcript_77988/g.130987  ORF Transcript_77988/g.130987 Transcript_77988/m.130987 type:complete len:216 (-) Transcript_77988:364-1011(-)